MTVFSVFYLARRYTKNAPTNRGESKTRYERIFASIRYSVAKPAYKQKSQTLDTTQRGYQFW